MGGGPSDGESREKAPVERFQRRRDSAASTPVCRLKKLKAFLSLNFCLPITTLFKAVVDVCLTSESEDLPPKSLFPVFWDAVFSFDSWSLHPDSLFWKKRMHKTDSLCHRKQELGLFGMQRIVFPCHRFPSNPSFRMQTLIDTVSFVHTKPWLLPEMDAGLLL